MKRGSSAKLNPLSAASHLLSYLNRTNMGLSGAKQKQRIPEDPRNTRWANDTAAPGFRLLSSMGWTPDAPGLGLAASQQQIAAGGSTAYSKKISVIPLAKSDNLGIGARGGAGIGNMRVMGVPVGSMGFVTASGSGSSTPTEAPKTGGEFGRLLERLNKAKAEAAALASASASEVEEGAEENKEGDEKEDKKARKERKKREKEEKKDKKKRKREGDDEGDAESTPVLSTATATPIDSPAASPAPAGILKNPRMAARSKHLRAKRLASSSNAAAMAEILGIAPPSITPPAPVSYVSQIPTTGLAPSAPAVAGAGIGSAGAGIGAARSEPLAVAPPSTEGWPAAPARKFPSFASASTTGLAATFDDAAAAPVVAPKPSMMSMFAKATTTTLEATFTPPVVEEKVEIVEVVEPVAGESEETEKDRRKREKREKKERKEAKRAKKLSKGNAAGPSTSTSEDDTPAPAPVVASKPLPGFAPASSSVIPATFEEAPKESEEDKLKREKKEKKEAKRAKKAAKGDE